MSEFNTYDDAKAINHASPLRLSRPRTTITRAIKDDKKKCEDEETKGKSVKPPEQEPLGRIKSVRFNVPRMSANKTIEYYTDVLGFEVVEEQGTKKWFRFPTPTKGKKGHMTLLELDLDDCKEVDLPRPGFWKLGLITQDCKTAANRIRKVGVPVGKPCQYQDIGFMCHTSDPCAVIVSILQDTSNSTSDSRCAKPTSRSNRLAATKPVLGQVSLRIRDPAKSVSFYKSLGMRLIATVPVKSYRFTLYFLAFTNAIQPRPDRLEAVANRKWLWQQPFTTLELQHSYDIPSNFKWGHPDSTQSGYQGITIETAASEKKEIRKLVDPDGYSVWVM